LSIRYLVLAGAECRLLGHRLDQHSTDEGDSPMKWSFDPAHTSLEVSAKHMMVTTVRGRFAGLRGEIDYDPKDPLRSTVWLDVDAASVNTGDDKRDAHLRSGDFLDVERHPKIRFESRTIKREGDHFTVTGNLTIRGKTRPVDVAVNVSDVLDDPWGGQRVAFECTCTIDRREWGLVWNMPIASGGLLVSNEMKVEASIQAVPAKAAPQEEVEEAMEEAEEARSA
jgi:polyisoprenoid-binding protein YceI